MPCKEGISSYHPPDAFLVVLAIAQRRRVRDGRLIVETLALAARVVWQVSFFDFQFIQDHLGRIDVSFRTGFHHFLSRRRVPRWRGGGRRGGRAGARGGGRPRRGGRGGRGGRRARRK